MIQEKPIVRRFELAFHHLETKKRLDPSLTRYTLTISKPEVAGFATLTAVFRSRRFSTHRDTDTDDTNRYSHERRRIVLRNAVYKATLNGFLIETLLRKDLYIK